MESLKPAKNLVDQTYEVILDAICNGMFKPGERLTQEDIAARLDVSRQPVTHALVLLKAQGFLVQTGKRGLMVSEVGASFFREIYEFRSAVEPLAVRLATRRLTPQLIVQGQSLVEHGRNRAMAGDAGACLQADMDFHSFIYDLSGNQIISETMRLYWLHLRRAMGEVLRHPGMSIKVWQEHGQILNAMIRGDADSAAELMYSHLVEAARRTGILPASPEPHGQ
ncbi:GntR family transcriptional regulator [Sedimenticola hydrogenitrophicus]|uniref:GntR family transcriptional regulator n=1 Tax=Sedimenticola hydrogenitrophicus TaxID=2967975 RepID=UPI0021A3126E|nr:GntR family transcriptional regulator [Sedimenticola hydrogenitrophicus]